ncbi:MAG: HET domain-containing protein [Methylobacter sp.]
MNTQEDFFRLLVPATDLTPPDTPFVELCGSRWVLTMLMPISDAPPYTCISYSWGSGRVDNVFEDGQLMSYRTIPTIEAAIKAAQSPEHWSYALMCTPRNEQKEATALATALKASQAIWIDELCMPFQNPARARCLLSLGAIYSSATQVFAVLSEPCAKLLHKVHSSEHMNADDLFVLENEDWLSRVWTLLEIIKSKRAFFIARGDDSVLFLALDFLNAILTDTTDYADAQGFKRYELSIRFPRLDRLQETIAMDRISEYADAGRSAFQVISEMQHRGLVREGDRIYAMIATITTDLPSDSLDDISLHPSEYFMRVCEAKGDYSFIYCIAPRSSMPGRGWRPVADQIPPVLSGLLTSGSGLSGSLKSTHLQMDNMCRMNIGTVNSNGISAIKHFLQSEITDLSPADIAGAILEQLRQKGFSGCGDHLKLENGYFFPQSSLTHSDDIFVATSHDVLWQDGGPGVLLRSNGTDINQFCDVGVFIGRFPKVSESINVG